MESRFKAGGRFRFAPEANELVDRPEWAGRVFTVVAVHERRGPLGFAYEADSITIFEDADVIAV